MKKKSKDDLQSRREFFRKAAKAALPILGAVVLANTPLLSQAVEKTPMGCNTNCKLACATTCYVGCEGKCADHCAHSCSESCKTTCKGLNRY